MATVAHRRREIGHDINATAASHQLVGVAHDARLNYVGKWSVLRIKVGSKLTGDERAPHVSPPVPRKAGSKSMKRTRRQQRKRRDEDTPACRTKLTLPRKYEETRSTYSGGGQRPPHGRTKSERNGTWTRRMFVGTPEVSRPCTNSRLQLGRRHGCQISP